MWTGHLAVLFGIKSTRLGKEHLAWNPLLITTFLADIIALLLILFKVELYSSDFQLISLYISHSLYTTIMLSILCFMTFSLFGEDKVAAIIYGCMPLVAYLLDWLAYPFVFGVWNNESIISGLFGYNWYNTVYILFGIELGFGIGLFLLYRAKNPHVTLPSTTEMEEKKPENPSGDPKQNELPQSKPEATIEGEKVAETSLKTKSSSSKLVLKRNDFLILLFLVIFSLPIIMKWFL